MVEGFCKLCDEGLYGGVVVGADNCLCQNCTTGIHDAALGGLSSNVNAYN